MKSQEEPTQNGIVRKEVMAVFSSEEIQRVVQAIEEAPDVETAIAAVDRVLPAGVTIPREFLRLPRATKANLLPAILKDLKPFVYNPDGVRLGPPVQVIKQCIQPGGLACFGLMNTSAEPQEVGVEIRAVQIPLWGLKSDRLTVSPGGMLFWIARIEIPPAIPPGDIHFSITSY